VTGRSSPAKPPIQPSPGGGRLSACRRREASPAGGGWWGASAAFLTLIVLGLFAFGLAALTFPPLSGRIVDQADIIPADTEAALTSKLAELEAKSGIQLVVATVRSLEGQEIEPYAVDLFRYWQLGEKAKNNGVLLLVAPNERRVRIEVGYGLEGTLTDAISSVIIANAITPRFKAGDFGGGIARGVDDIITVLTTDASEWQKRPALRLDAPAIEGPLPWIFLAVLIAVVTGSIVSPGFRWLMLNLMLNILVNSGRGRGGGFPGRGGSWSAGGGGFRGGGGSSGGGGASGRW
jgi:uncharacterized protein